MNLCEILSWVFNEKPGNLNYFLNFTFNFLFTALSTAVVGLWVCYIDYIVFKDYEKLKKKWYYFLPSVIMVVLSIINIFYPILFEISTSNVYARLPLIWSSIPLILASYIYVIVVVLKNDKTSNRRTILGVLIFLALPIIAAVLQLLNYGLLLIWPSTAVAIMISYLIFESTANARDYLTGVFNRERAEEQIERNIHKQNNFSILMVDIDHFKKINDTYGHHHGDETLKEVAKILKSVFNENALVSRYGGDEFLIVSAIYNHPDLDELKNQIKEEIKKSENAYVKNINLSFGVSICESTKDCTVEKVIVEADNNMYKNKQNYKQKEL
ncbi:GGDEF domain-containing protein [Candidatus Izemoplasma sp. B36]|uniref:GGDEF domain-containing protein n=1 Tax=Candidatus Izemoplasma sp. B36 TaxID=3242468 RepID=UPI003557FA63